MCVSMQYLLSLVPNQEWLDAEARRRSIPRHPRGEKTLAELLRRNNCREPPPCLKIDLTITCCAVVKFNGRWFVIMPEAKKGFGLFTLQGMRFGSVVGIYHGHAVLQCPEDSSYVLECKNWYINGDPRVATVMVNGIPIGWGGKAVLGFINEPSGPESPNVVYCEDEKGQHCYVVVGQKTIKPWSPLLVCYNSAKRFKSGFSYHNCTKSGCKEIVEKAQDHFISKCRV